MKAKKMVEYQVQSWWAIGNAWTNWAQHTDKTTAVKQCKMLARDFPKEYWRVAKVTTSTTARLEYKPTEVLTTTKKAKRK